MEKRAGTRKKEHSNDPEEVQREILEKDYMMEMGSVLRTRGPHAIHCLTVVGQIEGHSIAPQNQKTKNTNT